MKRIILIAGTMSALLMAGCGGGNNHPVKAKPNPRAEVEGDLLARFESSEYGKSVSMAILSESIKDLAVGVYDLDPEAGDKMDKDIEGPIRHSVSCIADGNNSFTCEHHIRGSVYKMDTTVDVAFDSAAHKIIIRSETDEKGNAYP